MNPAPAIGLSPRQVFSLFLFVFFGTVAGLIVGIKIGEKQYKTTQIDSKYYNQCLLECLDKQGNTSSTNVSQP